MGDVYCSLGQYSVALVHYERALHIFQKSLPSHHPHIAYTFGSIGLLYERSRQFDQSLCYFQKSVHIYQQVVPAMHPGRVRVEHGLLRVTENIGSTNMISA
jgi:tetratricopeptide (TPR) repeat protein